MLTSGSNGAHSPHGNHRNGEQRETQTSIMFLTFTRGISFKTKVMKNGPNADKPGTCRCLVSCSPISARFKDAHMTRQAMYRNLKIGETSYINNTVVIVNASSSAKTCYTKVSCLLRTVSKLTKIPAVYAIRAVCVEMGTINKKAR